MSRVPRWALPAVLFLLAALLSGITALKGVQPNDEGLMLQAAARIAHGEVPYRDFWWFYPPGQPYLLGGLWKVFGPSLVEWRVVRVLADATVALLVWELASRRVAAAAHGWRDRLPPLAAWLAAALAMAYPSGPHPFPIALALALGALLLFERRPLWAGLLAGACAAWRIEFAAYLSVGVLLAIAIGAAARDERVRAALRFVAGAVVAGLVLYVPVVAQAGIADSWDLLVRYPILQFSDYQSLPFPLAYDGPLNTSSIGGFLDDSAESLLLFYLPLVLVVGLASSLVALGAAFRRGRDAAGIATAVFGIGMAHYLLVRPDVFHAPPLAVVGAVLASWAITAALTERAGSTLPRWRRIAVLVAAVLAAASLTYTVVEGLDRRVLVLRLDTVALHAPDADGVTAEPGLANPLSAVVADVRRLVPPGEPIYVLGRRADITTAGAPLVYVLTERPNATRYDIQAPGVVTTAKVQREIIADLRRTRPKAIVRWTDPVTAAPEPNLSGVSSGVRLLDAYIAANYRVEARHGDWLVLVPR